MTPTNGNPDTVILVYDGDSGLRALLVDVAKKAVGREDCALCAITYSPIGKRREWARCESRLGVAVRELHRDELPASWNISRAQLPCILGRAGEGVPTILVTREQIAACRGSAELLERALTAALSERHGSPQ